ncbi:MULTISPECIES: transglutaminase-like cysteine peptidase [unclassified Motilimonas]|uniref:transglutaminase-like cysteine peptidase n=1 Tax=Motilimonas TaxID=1914248 RepID=UPI001E5C0E9F|nr:MULTISPECIES: transglutaminase-like cysteine peptidase [unclassified Motilimonas]MCE0559143.1 transglutaminase-like cysteine peptidase [Motilimonas sp. E26]MDO6525337.1 transglutaminase-like cysteine peptidase [Motilimonas sp. 1_MG-2023]
MHKRYFGLIACMLVSVGSFFSPHLLASELEVFLSQQSIRSRIADTYGDKAIKRIDALITTLQNASVMSQKQKLEEVNNFFNMLVYAQDQKLWGKNDYWASPLEFVGAKGGDCEDYSIAKYYSLMELGIAEEQLRLVYVKAVKYNQFHMVLAYYPSRRANPLILDNLEYDIIPASRRKDLLPVYSFNAKHLWVMGKAKKGEPVGSSDKLSEWKSVKSRFSGATLKSPRTVL